MRRLVMLLVAVAVAATAVFTAPASFGASPPTVTSTTEGLDSTTGQPVVALIGKKMNKYKTFAIQNPDGSPAGLAERTYKSKSLIVIRFDVDLPAGAYDLVLGFGRSDTQTHRIEIGNGQPLPGSVVETALAPTLATDLGDADTLGGEDKAYYRNVNNVDAGTLDTSRFSAYDDLVDSGKIGSATAQVAAGDHLHTGTYATSAHNHNATYVNRTGDTMTGRLTVTPPSGPAISGNGGTDIGVAGNSSSASGVFGSTMSGFGVFGRSFGTSGATRGVYGESRSSSGRGLEGRALATSGTNYGGYFESDSTSGCGVYGFADAASGTTYGGYFETDSGAGRAVYGLADNTSGTNYGGYFESRSSTGCGVYGLSTGTSSSSAIGVHGESRSTNGRGVFGLNTATTGAAYGGIFESRSTSGTGLLGWVSSSSAISNARGVWGLNDGAAGAGVRAESSQDKGTHYGLHGICDSSSTLSAGVFAESTRSGGTAFIANLATGNSSSHFIARFRDRGTDKVTIDRNGNHLALSYGNISDARLKEDITSLGDVLPKLRQVRGVRYRLKEGVGTRAPQIGVLAQEVRAQFPELVRETPDGTLSVHYGNMVGVLIEAVKEQQDQIEAQQEEIGRLRARDDRAAELEERLSRLEKLLSERVEDPAGPSTK